MRRVSYAVLALYLSLFTACTQLGTPQPQNLQQSIAYGYSTVASVRNTAATLLEAKTINVNDAKMVLGLTDQARAALDVAAVASSTGKVVDAQQALNLATQVLTQVQAYLKEKK